MRLRPLPCLAAASALLAGAVQAQTLTPLTVKDGSGASQPLCEYKPDGTNLAGCTVKWVWTGSSWVLEPTGAGTAAGAPRAVVAQDGSTVAGSAPGSFTQPVSGSVAGALSTSGGWTPKLLNGLSTTPVAVKGAAGQLGMVQCYNPNGSQIYVQVFDNASPTVGTTAPKLSIPISPNATGGFVPTVMGVQFANTIVVAATTTATGSTAPGTAPDCNAVYN